MTTIDPEGVTEYFTDEWLANDYLEEVRQSVAAMESVQPEAPVAEACRSCGSPCFRGTGMELSGR